MMCNDPRRAWQRRSGSLVYLGRSRRRSLKSASKASTPLTPTARKNTDHLCLDAPSDDRPTIASLLADGGTLEGLADGVLGAVSLEIALPLLCDEPFAATVLPLVSLGAAASIKLPLPLL